MTKNSTLTAFGVIAERFRRAGQAERAVAVCREGLSANPGHLSARVTLGLALMDIGQDYEALAALAEVRRRAPDNLAALRAMAELHERGIEEEPSFAEEPSFEEPSQPSSFAIEDVFDEAIEPEPELLVEPEPIVDLTPMLEAGSPSLDAASPALALRFADPDLTPKPLPQEKAALLAVFDDWLDHVEARRSGMLSEYAAG
jgi:hypothetical protein